MDFDRDALQIFTGGGQEHWLPLTVLEYSIRRHTDRLVQVSPLMGVEMRIPIPTPRDPKQRPVTSFSFQRFLIPQALDFHGKGIYLDSDMVVQADIGGLWDTPFPPGCHVNMCPGWQSAVMLIDAACGWRIEGFVDLLNRGALRYKDLVNVKVLGGCGNTLDPLWNCIDRPVPERMDVEHAKLLHYTDMGLQPWLTDKHPHGQRWIDELKAAIADEFVSVDDVLREIAFGHVRPSLALAVGEEAPYDDIDFVWPDHKRKMVIA